MLTVPSSWTIFLSVRCITSYSLQAVELQHHINGLFFGSGWQLDLEAVFESATSNAMAQHINEELFCSKGISENKRYIG